MAEDRGQWGTLKLEMENLRDPVTEFRLVSCLDFQCTHALCMHTYINKYIIKY